jgi:hypothetical protein
VAALPLNTTGLQASVDAVQLVGHFVAELLSHVSPGSSAPLPQLQAGLLTGG